MAKNVIKFRVGEKVKDHMSVGGYDAIVVAIIAPIHGKGRRYVVLHENDGFARIVEREDELSSKEAKFPSLSGKKVVVTLDGKTYKAVIK